MSFCAVCTSDRGPFTEQPLGKNDALVLVCNRCSTVEPNQGKRSRRVIVKEITDPRHAQIKAHRQRLTDEGLCMYGRNHGPKKHGRLCAACHERNRERNAKRKRRAA